MREGWNFVSLYCNPESTNLASVLGPVWQYLISVWTYDTNIHWWKRYIVNGPPVRNNLTTMEPGIGYIINMSADATLNLFGGSITNTSIDLRPGWNSVGFNSTVPLYWDEASLPIECKHITTYNNLTGEWPGYAPDGPPFMNTATQLIPGLAYWIYVIDFCTWDVGALDISDVSSRQEYEPVGEIVDMETTGYIMDTALGW